MSRKPCGPLLVCLLGAPLAAAGEEAAPGKTNPPAREPARAKAPRAGGEGRARPSGKRFDSVEKASEALLAIERQLRALESAAVERRRAAEERLADLLREREVLERSTAILTERVTAIEKELQAKKEKAAKDEAETAKLKNQSDQILETVKRFLARVEKHIDEGLPWQVEARKQALAEAREELAAPGLEPRDALALAGRVHEGEESLGRLIEPGSVVLAVGGEKRAVPAFHLGLLALAYASEDGSLLGYVHSGQKLEEGKIDTGAGEGGEEAGTPDKAAARVAEAYRAALAVLDRRLSPRLIDLYLPALPASEERR